MLGWGEMCGRVGADEKCTHDSGGYRGAAARPFMPEEGEVGTPPGLAPPQLAPTLPRRRPAPRLPPPPHPRSGRASDTVGRSARAGPPAYQAPPSCRPSPFPLSLTGAAPITAIAGYCLHPSRGWPYSGGRGVEEGRERLLSTPAAHGRKRRARETGIGARPQLQPGASHRYEGRGGRRVTAANGKRRTGRRLGMAGCQRYRRRRHPAKL